MARIAVCVTNDLTYDQRMIRCCRTLVEAGHDVTFIGRELPRSVDLDKEPFEQVRLTCRVNSGPLFYAEINRKLRSYLNSARPELAISCDLDTLLAVSTSSRRSGFPFIYDSHEYFTEVPELEGRSLVKNVWYRIGRHGIPKAAVRYTVGPKLAEVLSEKYGHEFGVVRNVPFRRLEAQPSYEHRRPWILYQGALNKGRGIEHMIEAMRGIHGLHLILVGEGDLSTKLRQKVVDAGLKDKVDFLGKVAPAKLADLTSQALIGINLLEGGSLNYYYSLANKFFDYMQAGTPSINMAFPEYEDLLERHKVGVGITDLSTSAIVQAVDHVRQPGTWNKMQQQCRKASDIYCWENERETLLNYVNEVLAVSSK